MTIARKWPSWYAIQLQILEGPRKLRELRITTSNIVYHAQRKEAPGTDSRIYNRCSRCGVWDGILGYRPCNGVPLCGSYRYRLEVSFPIAVAI